MKAYRFSLEAVMRIRSLEERIAREHLMVAQRELRYAQGECAELERAMDALTFPSQAISMGTVHWFADQATRLAEEVRASQEAVSAATSKRDEASRAWHRARKRVGALERLDLEGLVRWKDSAARYEVAELDDIANVRHGLSGVRR